ncbi:MAG: peptide deformylase [Myxococcales bacterium]|nr:peptide deformylase [Myxococcales bacterium]
MAVLDIMLYPHSVLRERCAEVTEFDASLHQLLDDMAETMYAAKGAGLAAPQVNEAQRVIVIDVGREDRGRDLLEFVNPKITAFLGDRVIGEEGCLSFPDIYEPVERYEAIKFEAQDRSGTRIQMEVDGFLAIVIQHEVDHINGVLFIDKLSRLRQGLAKRKMKKRYGKTDLRRRVGEE